MVCDPRAFYAEAEVTFPKVELGRVVGGEGSEVVALVEVVLPERSEVGG